MLVAWVACCVVAAASAAFVPEQIHLAFAGNDVDGNSNHMAVSWATPGQTPTSTVLWGTSANALTNTATGFAVTYLAVRKL
jgi:hypothetical protein